MNFKKYIINTLAITCLLISNTMATKAELNAPLSEGEVSSIASVRALIPTEIIMGDINNLFVGPEEINDREWTLEGVSDPDRLRTIMQGDFVVQLLDSDTDQFMCTPFTVDAQGKLRFEVIIRDLVAGFTEDNNGVEGLDLSETEHVRVALESQLTADELALPIVKRFQSPLTFEEMNQSKRKAAEEAEKIGDDQEAPAPLNARHFLKVDYPKFVTMGLLLCNTDDKEEMLADVNEMHDFFSQK